MKYNKIIIVMTVVCLTTGFTKVRRYKKATSEKTTAKLSTLSLFSAKIIHDKAEEKKISLWDLKGKGQEQLIHVLHERAEKDNDRFFESLNTTYLKEDETGDVVDYTNKDLMLVFSIGKTKNYASLKTNFSPADRIENARFSVILPDAVPVEFVRWNKFSSEYTTLDIADVSFTSAYEIAASVGQTNSKSKETSSADGLVKNTVTGEVTPSLSGTYSNSKTESQKVRFRYCVFNGSMSRKTISMEEEGTREIDLTGNVSAEVHLHFAEAIEITARFKSLLDDKKAYNNPEKVKLSFTTNLVPDMETAPEQIKAGMSYQYVYRHVKKNARTFYEWDDVVKYYYSDDEKLPDVTLFNKKDIFPPFYFIGLKGKTTGKTKPLLKLVNKKDQAEINLLFSNYQEARTFLEWLAAYESSDTAKPIEFGIYQLVLSENGSNTVFTKKLVTERGQELEYARYYQ